MIKDNIICGNCVEILKNLPSKSVDMIFADPPYFMQTDGELLRNNGEIFSGVSDEWDKFDSFSHYDEFCEAWLKECKRILKDNATI